MSDASGKEIVAHFVDAVAGGSAAAAEMLLAHPELREARWLNEPLIHFLAIENFLGGVEFLIRNGFDVDELDGYGASALYRVVHIGNLAAVELLIRSGARASFRSVSEDFSTLELGISCGHVEIVDWLLKSGVDVGAGNDVPGAMYLLGQMQLLGAPDMRERMKGVLVAHNLMTDGSDT